MQSVTNKVFSNNNAEPSAELSLAIVVPLLNEIDHLPSLVKELGQVNAEKIIIVDGGSDDGSYQWLNEHWQDSSSQTQVSEKILMSSPAGRAAQMNAGAELATQDVLLFLHADTVLPSDAKSLICNLSDSSLSKNYWGRFDVSFDEPSLVMNIVAFFINWRSRISGVATGDQAIFVRRTLFEGILGFDNIALMEDVALSKKLKKFAKPDSLKSKAITSARRWKKHGVVKTIVKMWWYRLAFFAGVSPESLANGYRNVR